jgi:hypothetical protein
MNPSSFAQMGIVFVQTKVLFVRMENYRTCKIPMWILTQKLQCMVVTDTVWANVHIHIQMSKFGLVTTMNRCVK